MNERRIGHGVITAGQYLLQARALFLPCFYTEYLVSVIIFLRMSPLSLAGVSVKYDTAPVFRTGTPGYDNVGS